MSTDFGYSDNGGYVSSRVMAGTTGMDGANRAREIMASVGAEQREG